MSSSSVHLAFGRQDQIALSEMHYAYFTSVWIAEQVILIAVLMIDLRSTCFMFFWWFFILKNLLEVNATSWYCQGLSVSHESEWKPTSKYHLTSKNNHFSLVCIKGQWTFVKASTFISERQLIPSWKSCPNPPHLFAKLQIGLEPSKMKVFRGAWLLNFRWNRSPKGDVVFH